jgi:GNAT superfamily N-acetyltransferase
MLLVFDKVKNLSFSQLMMVYEEGNRENAEEFWPDMEEGRRMIRAEQEFYQYLREVFFPTEHARYFVWEENGNYISALRLEPYRDGLLLEALETHPEYRRKGYAGRLIRAVQEVSSDAKIYSHVSKRNMASLKTHDKCGFRRIAENAVYADGSVTSRSCTLCWEGKK